MPADTRTHQWWRSALAGEKPPIHADHPECGYYKTRSSKDGPWVPAAIYINDKGLMVCDINGHMADPASRWTWLAKNPVSYEDYKHFYDHGEWPRSDAAKAADPPPAEGSKPGHNQPPQSPQSPQEFTGELASRIFGWMKGRKLKTQEDADLAGEHFDRARKCRQRLEEKKKEELEPHANEVRKINGAFKQMIGQMEKCEYGLKAMLGPWIEANGPVSTETGTISTFKMYHAKIEDIDKVIEHFKTRGEFLTALQKMADAEARALKGQGNLPGCKMGIKRGVR